MLVTCTSGAGNGCAVICCRGQPLRCDQWGALRKWGRPSEGREPSMAGALLGLEHRCGRLPGERGERLWNNARMASGSEAHRTPPQVRLACACLRNSVKMRDTTQRTTNADQNSCHGPGTTTAARLSDAVWPELHGWPVEWLNRLHRCWLTSRVLKMLFSAVVTATD